MVFDTFFFTQLLKMADHPNKLAFEEGARYIFNNWTALRLAVEQDWGGVESPEKKEWFIDVVIDYFAKRKDNKNGKRKQETKHLFF